MGKICPLFSGSKGNCTFISADGEGVLIDAGVSCKKILEALGEIAIQKNSIKAIFITHEHSDHIAGLKVLLKTLTVPVYCSEKTAKALNHIYPEINAVGFENEIKICGMKIRRFNTSHDCDGSSGYRVFLPDGSSAAVCTDTGVLSNEILNTLSGSDAVLIESNHCVTMLQKGPYPPELKQRILSDKGHLSNTDCACAALKLYESGTRRFILAHLSENNNLPSLALSTTQAVFMDKGLKKDTDYILYIAKPSQNEITYF